MGHRLSKIATRTGDDGTTGLGDGSRVGKDSARIQALGDVDELNSVLGVLLAETLTPDLHSSFLAIQHDLFDFGAELAVPGYVKITTEHVTRLDDLLSHLNSSLSMLKEFILPGGVRSAALAHQARSICRRAERSVVALANAEPESISQAARQYLNRLSDLLFVTARHLNQLAGTGDVLWQPGRHAPTSG